MVIGYRGAAHRTAARPARGGCSTVADGARGLLEPRAEAEFSIGLMDRQRLEPRRNAYDAFVTLPRAWRRRSSIATSSIGLVLRTWFVTLCESCISLTSASRWSAPTASSRWKPATRSRRAATTVTLVVRPDTHAPARDPFVFYGLPRIAGAARRDRRRSPGRPAARRAGYLTFAIGRAMGRARQDRDLHARSRAGVAAAAHARRAARAGRLRGARDRRRRRRGAAGAA